jgi:TetR/AcrR family transcriptional repressor of nem operon
MSAETREMILAAARSTVQAHGYNGLSFRDLAQAVGIRSASVHYHFPTKGDLGAALARAYTEGARADLDAVLAENRDPGVALKRYTALFRKALENGNRMCLCGILAAETDELPEQVRAEVRAFSDLNIGWLAALLGPGSDARARAIYAAVSGAQLVARGRADVTLFDEIVESYRSAGLIPG